MTTATATRSSLSVRHISSAIVTALLAIIRGCAAFTTGVLIAGFVLILSGLIGMIAGYNFTHVASASMEPTIMTGDYVLTRPHTEGDLQPGTILSYRMVTPDRTISVTHRVIAVQDGQATMKGDNNEAADPHTIGAADVLGVVTFRADGAAVRLGIGVYLGAVVLFLMCGSFEKLLSRKRA